LDSSGAAVNTTGGMLAELAWTRWVVSNLGPRDQRTSADPEAPETLDEVDTVPPPAITCQLTVVPATPFPFGSDALTVASRQLPNATPGLPMLRWAGTMDQVTLQLIGGLSAMAPTQSEAGETLGAPSASSSGPRVRPEILGVEPSLAERNGNAPPPAPAKNHTIVLSTLAVVLIAVIVTILVVK